jgi:DNA-binding MarR family transcriptional regulator
MKDIQYSINEIRSFNRFYTSIIGVLDKHILNSSYSLTEVRILFEIYNNPFSTARKITNFLQVDEGYISHAIKKLIKDGLIMKNKSESDGRTYFLSLTEKGKKQFSILNEESDSSIKELINPLSEEEINNLVLYFSAIKQILSKGDHK